MIANIVAALIVSIAVLALEITPQVLLIFLILAVVAFALGYAFRGVIRRELALLPSEAALIAARLEAAARTDDTALANEVSKIISELRAKV